MKTNEKLENLTEDDVWLFTKQSIDFDNAFRAVKLFNAKPHGVNLEDYFENKYLEYGLNTHRHRVLIISQLLGLLTKKNPFTRGGGYNDESATQVFRELEKHEIGSYQYNTIKSEQILKLKIRAIIDTVGSNIGWSILPVIFSYKVLKSLLYKYKISEIDIDQFYTYVMTCKNENELESSIQYLSQSSPVSKFVETFKDRSRFIQLISNNINLFVISESKISLNPGYIDIVDTFLKDNNIIGKLNRVSDLYFYQNFLTTLQSFNINLIDQIVKTTTEEVTNLPEVDDYKYQNEIQGITSKFISEETIDFAYLEYPQLVQIGETKQYLRNPSIGKTAIEESGYNCENNHSHDTFISRASNHPFMEAHHLIPMSKQDLIWEKFTVNLDCSQNIVSLCPNCHRAIHYGNIQIRNQIIEELYNKKHDILRSIGISLSIDELIEFYNS